MKTPYKLIVAAIALSIANIAFASATLRDVETAVDVNRDFRRAETLIREVVANDPDNAKDRYVYSQILRRNGKHDDAVHELAEAKRLDPAITFDKKPARFSAYEASLNAEGGRQPSLAPRVRAEQYAVPETARAQAIEPERDPGRSLLWVALILGALGVAGYFFYRRVQEHDRLEDEERIKAARQDQMKQASALLESVKPLKLDIRMASPANPSLLAEVDDTETALVSLIERLEKLPVPQGEIEQQAESLAHLRRKFEGKPDPVATTQPGHECTAYDDANGFGRPAVGSAYQQPGPVYGGNNNGGLGGVGGLLAGLAVGSMMGGGHDRDVIREVREVPSRQNGNDDSGGGQSDIDFGNDSDSGGVDFGSSDDN